MGIIARFRITISLYLILIGLILNPFSASAQFYDYQPIGARSIGMGGTGIASARGGESIYHNPALMGMEKFTELTFSIRNRNERIYSCYETNSVDGYDHLGSHLASLVVPLPAQDKRFAIGIAHARVMEPILYSNEWNGAIQAISPAFAMRVDDKWRFGAAINFWTGYAEYNEIQFILPELLHPPFGELDDIGSYSMDDASYSGLNSTIGVSYLLYQKYQQHKVYLGATLRTPFALESNGSFPFYFQNAMTWEADDVKVKIPGTLGVGCSYVRNYLSTFSLDYEIHAVNEQTINERIEKAYGDTVWTLYDFQKLAKQTHHFRIGVEHRLQFDETRIPLRMGFVRESTPLQDSKDRQVWSQTISLGTGLASDNFRVDFAYELQSFNQDLGTLPDYIWYYDYGNVGYLFSTWLVSLSVNIDELF